MTLRISTNPAWLTRAAWAYAILFGLVVLVGHLPGVNDAEGRLFGLFHITLYQDLLHGASGAWAAWAAWRSVGSVVFYFRWFGTIYFLDGVVGSITGRTFLDFGLFTGKAAIEGTFTRVLANAPHVAIGGLAVVLGFWYARRALRTV